MVYAAEDVKENYIVSSLVRGLRILSAFTVKGPALKVSEVAEMTGLDQATVFRFIYTLEHLGYLVRDEDTKRYHQSVRMLTLCLPARASLPVRELALPTMSELSQKIDESVKLAVLDGVDIVMIGVVEILNKMSYKTPIGHRMPAYCTALGKAMLAFQPLDRWDHLISMIEFVPRTKNTITDPDEFRATLLQVRERGYALQNGEFVEGLGSVAAPIFEHGGEVATAVNISGLSTLILDEKKVDGMVSGIIDCARAISAKLGYVPEISG
jgi:IclR family pca regulon transcriptional regulator